MTTEFNLSEFVGESEHPYHISTIPTEKFKEFIRLLKEQIKKDSDCYFTEHWNTIDKLAGEKLK